MYFSRRLVKALQMSSKTLENKFTSKHHPLISKYERSKLLGHQPLTVWMTGLSASGKSTLAYALEAKLYEIGIKSYVLDGDNVRHGLNSDLGFSHQDRSENIRRVAEVASLLNDSGLVVISAFISPYNEDRLIAKKIIGENYFIEVYLNTPIETCEERDPKLLYEKARRGVLADFTGVSAPYEQPKNPDITFNTASTTLEANLSNLVEFLLPKILLKAAKA